MIGVLFTGGLDSTYLVYKNLKEGNRVQPYYVYLENNATKAKREQIQMEKIWNVLNEMFPQKIMKPRTILETKITSSWYHKFALCQPPIWVFALSWIQSNVHALQVAYVEGDDAVSYIDKIKNLYEAYRGFIYDEVLIPLEFPLINTSKADIMWELPKELCEHIWSCEPQYTDREANKPCGECITCEKYRKLTKELEIDLIYKFPNIFEMEWSPSLEKEFTSIIKDPVSVEEIEVQISIGNEDSDHRVS